MPSLLTLGANRLDKLVRPMRYLGDWILIPELSIYASGEPPVSGRYVIAATGNDHLTLDVSGDSAAYRTHQRVAYAHRIASVDCARDAGLEAWRGEGWRSGRTLARRRDAAMLGEGKRLTAGSLSRFLLETV